jgi:hypothetical protein
MISHLILDTHVVIWLFNGDETLTRVLKVTLCRRSHNKNLYK